MVHAPVVEVVGEAADGPHAPRVSVDAKATWDTAPARSGWRSRPSLLLEQRATLELVELLANPVYYGLGVPRGDGSPVLLLPGFLGSDDYLSIMRGWLRRIGYRPYGSGLALCAGPIADLIARVLRRVETVAAAEGRPLTLVGHSMGGILSLVVARRRPELVEHVVTLGSAVCDDPRGASHPLVVAMADLLSWDGSPSVPSAARGEHDEQFFDGPLADGIRLTCIYSREDAVVDWRACIGDDPRTAAFEVRGTHSGLVWNAEVYRHLGRQLPLV